MTPQTGTAVLVIAAFVLPGFITLLWRERTYAIRGQESAFERLLNALYYSSLIYGIGALAGWLLGFEKADITQLWKGDASFAAYVLLAVGGLFVLPLGIAEFGRRWNRSRRLRPWVLKSLRIDPGHSVPAGWEQMFAQSPGALEGRGLLLRVTLDDGRIVGGFFGDDSLAGYTAHTRDLFIEERWSLDDDDWFEAPAEGSQGVWISDRQIESVEAYAPPSPTPGFKLVGGTLGKLVAVALVARLWRDGHQKRPV
jgi:hypothetical protein